MIRPFSILSTKRDGGLELVDRVYVEGKIVLPGGGSSVEMSRLARGIQRAGRATCGRAPADHRTVAMVVILPNRRGHLQLSLSVARQILSSASRSDRYDRRIVFGCRLGDAALTSLADQIGLKPAQAIALSDAHPTVPLAAAALLSRVWP